MLPKHKISIATFILFVLLCIFTKTSYAQFAGQTSCNSTTAGCYWCQYNPNGTCTTNLIYSNTCSTGYISAGCSVWDGNPTACRNVSGNTFEGHSCIPDNTQRGTCTNGVKGCYWCDDSCSITNSTCRNGYTTSSCTICRESNPISCVPKTTDCGGANQTCCGESCDPGFACASTGLCEAIHTGGPKTGGGTTTSGGTANNPNGTTSATSSAYGTIGSDYPLDKVNPLGQCKNRTLLNSPLNQDDFHSLRPYPGDTCIEEVSDAALFCANDLIIKQTFSVYPSQGSCSTPDASGVIKCRFAVSNTVPGVQIDLTGAELPIAGNTEDVANSVNKDAGLFDNATKMNEYLSWYLNGAIYRAEEAPPIVFSPFSIFGIGSKQTHVDYAGPLRKLLPFSSQLEIRSRVVKDSATDIRHDQTVACTISVGTSYLESLEIILGVETPSFNLVTLPFPCYRLQIVSDIARVLPGLNFNTKKLSDFQAHLPPLQTDAKYQNQSFAVYWADYQEWRGKICVVIGVPKSISALGVTIEIPIIGGLQYPLCAEGPGPNVWGDLFPYIPFSSTEDRIGEITASPSVSQPSYGGVSITPGSVTFIPSGQVDDLFFAHLQEVSELSKLLQSTFGSAGELKKFEAGNQYKTADLLPTKENGCVEVETRNNPGDKLLGNVDVLPGHKKISGDVTYQGEFECDFKPDASGNYKACEKEAYVAMEVFTQTPKIEEIWQRLMAGPQAVFKRFFPKELADKEIEKDIPAVANINYVSGGDSETYAGDTTRPGSAAELYIPHLGSIYDGFLRGIQRALRPKGFEGNISLGGVGNDLFTPIPNPFESVECPTNGPVSPAAYTPGVLCSINCDASVPDSAIPSEYLGETKQRAVQLANRWVATNADSNHSAECYNDVVKKSLERGINPIFSLAIWTQESDASNYNLSFSPCTPGDPSSIQDFGINDGSIAGNFNAQLNRLLILPLNYPAQFGQCFQEGCNWGNFSLVYQQGVPAQGCQEGMINYAARSYAYKTLKTMGIIDPSCNILYPTEFAPSCPAN